MTEDSETPTQDQAEDAAHVLASDDTLLPGEASAMRSQHTDDAVHWRRVYEELFEFKQALLATLLDQRGKVDRDGKREVENDEIVLTREANRLSRRLEFWRQEVSRRR